MGFAEFWQRQRMIESGKLRPRVLKPRKKKKDKNEVSEQEFEKMTPEIQKKINYISELELILMYTEQDLNNFINEAEKGDDLSAQDIDEGFLWNIAYDLNKFLEKKCKLLNKRKREIVEREIYMKK